MISIGFKTLHIWIENIRKGVKFTHQPYNFNLVLVLQHLKDVFFFQYAGEINGIQIPFTIGIQTPTQ